MATQIHQSEKEAVGGSTGVTQSSGSSSQGAGTLGSGGSTRSGQSGPAQYGTRVGREAGSFGAEDDREFSSRERMEEFGQYESARRMQRSGGYGEGGGSYGAGAAAVMQEWKHKAENAIHPLEEYTRERPLTSLLIAAGIGTAIGFLLRR